MEAYDLSMEICSIFNSRISKSDAFMVIDAWYDKVMRLGNDNFRKVLNTYK